MTTTGIAEKHLARRKYSSPLHALVWSFRKSRDNWKRKYSGVKADLECARRRLDRLDQAKPSLPPPLAQKAKPAVSPSLPLPAAKTTPPVSSTTKATLTAFLLEGLVDLRQQVQDNRDILEQCQEQNQILVDLTRQLQQLLPAAMRLQTAGTPMSVQTPPQSLPVGKGSDAQARPSTTTSVQTPPQPTPVTVTAPVLPKISLQAPPEPKKGAHRYGH